MKSKIRDRVVELRRVRAGDLLPNPHNWRRHSESQRQALRGVLSDVGFADVLLARETDEGLMLIDGHLRRDTTPDQMVPVVVLDVDEREADYLIATLDPLSGMATANAEALDALLREVNTGSAAVQQMLADLADHAGLYTQEVLGEDDEVDKPDRAGASPWDRVAASDKVRCLIGDVEFSVSTDVAEAFAAQCRDMNLPMREAAEQWFTQRI